jgi:glycosyltransferase involved in cell wall biosynthesis
MKEQHPNQPGDDQSPGLEPDPVSPETDPDSVSIVIPVHNEEMILRRTVELIHAGLHKRGLDSVEIILSENGSADATRRVAEDLAREIPRVTVLQLDRPDYGAAMKAGFLAARGQFIVNFDADYFDLDFLAMAMRADADIVIAAKGLLGSHDSRILIRRIISRSFGWLVRRLLGVRVTETHGMKLFVREAIAPLANEVESTQDLFDTELIARADWAGLRITEVPIRTEELRHSRTGIFRRIPRTLWGLVKLRRRLRKLRAQQVRPSVVGR